MPRSLPRSFVVLVSLAIVVAACDGASVPSPLPSAAASVTPAPDASARTTDAPTPAASSVAAAAAVGPWRPIPIHASADVSGPAEGACRAADAAIEDLPLALADLRGEGQLTLVFAEGGAPRAFACRTVVDDESATTVVPIDVPAEPVGDEAIDWLLYQAFEGTDKTRTLLVGRVGRVAADVITAFPDESYVWATEGGGWYSMWWAGRDKAMNVAAVDMRNFVIEAAPLP